MNGSDLLVGALVIPALLLLSAALVAAEIALVAVRRTELDESVAAGRPGARAARALVEHLDRPIAAIQLGITSIGLLLGWFSEASLADAVRPHLGSSAASHALAGALILVSLTALQVVLGELVPKAVALQHPRAVALLVAPPLRLFSRLLAPAVWALNGAAALVLRPFGSPVTPARRSYSVHELALLVDETTQAGALRAEQAEVVLKVFRLTGKTARDIMVPLERVGMLELGWSSEQILDAVVRGAHTRMPVCELGQRTQVKGLVNSKDLFRQYSRAGSVRLEEILRPIATISPQARVEEELQRFRQLRLHMALVHDGQVPLGIVTLEDMLEEIVGEIEDEHDRGSGGIPRAGVQPQPRPA